VHPIVFKLGPFSLHWYGVMVATAFLAGLWTAGRRGPLAGVAGEKIVDLGPWAILGAIVGSRVFYIVSYWHEAFAGKPIGELFMIWKGGLVYYGGLIGAALAFIIYVKLKKLPLWKLADVFAPSIPLGCFFGRIGCFLNGCCYGRPCNLPWAVCYPADNPLEPPTHPVHPTQLYDSLLNLCLYGFLAWLFRRRKFDGQVFSTYLVGYALLRSFVEFFRGDYLLEQRYFGGWATPAHLVSLLILVAGLVLLQVLPRLAPKRE
jgi:phosphatidylglycerol---prolipoprotein diacylglyceryl transferase